MFYEIRRYQTRPGMRDEWVEYMEGTVIPYMTERGMSVIASLVDEEDPDGYVTLRRFASEAEHERIYAATYQTDRWKNEIYPMVEKFLDLEAVTVTRASPTHHGLLL
ncbi:NIPSNAP family protein [Sphaerisporangium sp. NPDC005288]|uniref:NIPSNAP family protein n=1 Tax=Sphaerisporangium rhizosphaerae TaxID=2269375 RepID=A0ABW2P1S6_9ACTN